MLHSRMPAGKNRQLAVAVRDPALQAILGALLEEWLYAVVPRAEEATLVLLEEGLAFSASGVEVVRLARFPSSGRDRIALPIVVEELWAALEPRFHRPPRAHIRIDLDRPAVVSVRGEREATRIVSLSDLGTRFSLTRELVNDEQLQLDVELDGRTWHLEGRVIYVIPRGDLDGSGAFDIGMLFIHPAIETRGELRNLVVRRYLERVARRLPSELFYAGLAHFALPSATRKALVAE
ncbi:hypothetical protein JCM30471_30380 [Desulfuromonas carbonis]|uniref:PilZ domain-containing protein n=1 Tax=Desulfuromonas sp. DDH964 TaxID=1823759 RepID=UPI00078C6716|nr:PilZ domain-containing protein [Desulfuromonas sp. DDH964]AMV71198.1 hypothetical protein DBW_0815 [Desulfuromonas sp. DDH964]